MKKWNNADIVAIDISETANGLWPADKENKAINIGDGYLFGSHVSTRGDSKKGDDEQRPGKPHHCGDTNGWS